MLLTAGACLGADNVAVGFVLGLLLAWALRLEPLFTVERERVTSKPDAVEPEVPEQNQKPGKAVTSAGDVRRWP